MKPQVETITRTIKCFPMHRTGAQAKMERKGWTYVGETNMGNYIKLEFERREVHVVDQLGRRQVMRV